MTNDNRNEPTETSEESDAEVESAPGQPEQGQAQSGPAFTTTPDPLAGVRKSAADVLASMEGKTVSMKVYVGTIAAVIVLMLLARCGG